MALEYNPPKLDKPIPYPRVLDWRTGEPFTAPTIAAIHHHFWLEICHKAESFLNWEAGLTLARGSRRVNSAIDQLTDALLFEGLAEAQAHNEAQPDLEGSM